MAYKYILVAEAQDEYESALNWYLERSIKAAENFIEEVEFTLCLICEHPNRWRNEFDIYFELGLKKYPYNVVYTFEEQSNLVVVRSIYHHSRNPEKKYRR